MVEQILILLLLAAIAALCVPILMMVLATFDLFPPFELRVGGTTWSFGQSGERAIPAQPIATTTTGVVLVFVGTVGAAAQPLLTSQQVRTETATVAAAISRPIR